MSDEDAIQSAEYDFASDALHAALRLLEASARHFEDRNGELVDDPAVTRAMADLLTNPVINNPGGQVQAVVGAAIPILEVLATSSGLKASEAIAAYRKNMP